MRFGFRETKRRRWKTRADEWLERKTDMMNISCGGDGTRSIPPAVDRWRARSSGGGILHLLSFKKSDSWKPFGDFQVPGDRSENWSELVGGKQSSVLIRGNQPNTAFFSIPGASPFENLANIQVNLGRKIGLKWKLPYHPLQTLDRNLGRNRRYWKKRNSNERPD